MARQLWLLRHADAEPHGTRADAERRLTARGERQARAAGIAIERLGVAFDEVLVSPKERARRTAELAAADWSAEQRALLSEYPQLAGDFDARRALDALVGIPTQDGRLLLVGHEPDLSLVAAELTGARIDLKKGGLAVVRLEGGAGGRRPASRGGRVSIPQSEGGEPRLGYDGVVGELVVLMRPRELALIAGVPVDRG